MIRLNKDKILCYLKKNEGRFISGEELCKLFNISRTAIWKSINILRNEGYVIESLHKSGYMLKESPDILSYLEIAPFLNTNFIGRNYLHKNLISSTNDYAKEYANYYDDGTVIVAERQESGKGRLGRKWLSNESNGIWMSIILKPNLNPHDVVSLTQVAAISVVNAIEENTICKAGIKWPNDIIINDKKVCGILTEMSSEIDKINYIIVGIGLNVNISLFPDDISNKATSLMIELSEKIDRKKLLASILNNFEKFYSIFLRFGFNSVRDMCKKYSITIGRDVIIKANNIEYTGYAVDIDNDGNLIVETKNYGVKKVLSGDVSVRGLLGYM